MSGLAESIFVPLTIFKSPRKMNDDINSYNDLNKRLQALLAQPWLMDQGPEHVQDREWQAMNEPLQRDIDALSQALLEADNTTPLYASAVHRLRKICRQSGLTPTSCFLTPDVLLSSTLPISQSNFSDIYRGKVGGVDVAVKAFRVHIDKMEEVKKAYLHELVVWQCLRHPNIVPFVGASRLFNVSLVSKWMEEGTISTFLNKRPSEDRRKYIEDIVHGLMFMHSLDVVHGDMKAANILVDRHHQARIADLGLATLMHATNTLATYNGTRGTIRWMAPELLEGEDLEEEEETNNVLCILTKASDTYALAITIWELFSMSIPFENVRQDLKVVRWVLQGKRPTRPPAAQVIGLDDLLWDFIEQCWTGIPHHRPPLSGLLSILTNASPASSDCSPSAGPPQTEPGPIVPPTNREYPIADTTRPPSPIPDNDFTDDFDPFCWG